MGITENVEYIFIVTGPEITSTGLESGTVGTDYSAQLAGSSNSAEPALTWSVTSGTLPTGISLKADGQFTGSTATTGSFAITVRATDKSGAWIEKGFTVTIGTAIGITTESPLPEATTNTSYKQILLASGASNITWSLVSGSLPDGLTLDSSGTIYGTPTIAGTYVFFVKAASADDAYAVAIKSFTIVVSGPSITTTALPSWTTGVANSYTMAGTPTGLTWSISSGTLPTGLSLSSAGVLSGTTSQYGTYRITIKATDPTTKNATEKTYTLTVSATFGITTGSTLASAQLRSAYNQSLSVRGADKATWSVLSGTLPDGLALDSAGTIYGTPTTKGTSTFFLKAVSGDDATVSAIGSFTITVQGPVITTSTMTTGKVGSAFSQTLEGSSDGSSTLYWTVTDGTLPDGITLGKATGKLSGTPTTAGSYTFTVRLTDGNGAWAEKSYTLTVNATLAITTTSPLPGAKVNTVYKQTMAVSGSSSVTWSLLSGSLPAGITLDSTTGVLYGTPTEAGNYIFFLQATDSANTSVKAISGFVLTVDGPAITTDTTLAEGTVGSTYTTTLTAKSSKLVTWSKSGSWPDWLTLNTKTGVVSGTPTTAGTYTFTAVATDTAGLYAEKTFTLTVAAAATPSASTTATTPTTATTATTATSVTTAATAKTTTTTSSSSATTVTTTTATSTTATTATTASTNAATGVTHNDGAVPAAAALILCAGLITVAAIRRRKNR